jgi:hypothetical protein
MVSKLCRFHLVANALSWLPNNSQLVGVPNQTNDVHIFTLKLEWLQSVYGYLLEEVMLERFITS